MSSTTSASQTPVTRPTWSAPWVVTATWRTYILLLFVRGVAIGLFSLADVIFIKTTVDLVLQANEAVSWFVAVLLALGAVAMALTTGHLARVAAIEGRSRLAAHVLAIGWLFLGSALIAMRFNAAAWTAGAVEVEGAATSPFDETAMHQGMAILLALIYVASGVWGYVEGRHLFNPYAQQYVLGRQTRVGLVRRLVAQGGVVNRSVEDLQRARGQMEALVRTRAAAEDARRALAAELMAEARIRIANHLGDPASTGITELAPERSAQSDAAQSHPAEVTA